MIIMIISFTNVYSQIKQARPNPLSKLTSQPPPSPPSSYQPPDTVDDMCFLNVSSSSVNTPLSSQVGNVVLIDAFNVISRVLSMVLFLRASCCFPAETWEDSLYPSSRCRATMELSPHPNDIRVRLVDMSVPWQTPSPIVEDAFLTELVIRDVKNWCFFHPLL